MCGACIRRPWVGGWVWFTLALAAYTGLTLYGSSAAMADDGPANKLIV